jgi:light-regulated signal transduction histidine kinase (bacteriophytochrome)
VVAARKAIAYTGRLDVTFRLVRPSGEVRWFRSKGASVPSLNSTLVVGAVVDITEQMELQEHLARANEELLHFSYAASHDLRAPLRTMNTLLELVERKLEGSLDTETKRYLDLCRTGALRMHRLLDSLLTYSIITEPAAAEKKRADSKVALDEAIGNLSALIEESGARIEDQHLPQVAIDQVALCHVFQNLLSNAIKYRGQESPVIVISAATDGMFSKFAVRDNGIGIEAQYHDRIFGLLQRLHTQNQYEGTGMGLAICQKIIQRSGGRIWVNSTPGDGSTFYFTIPSA